MTGIVGGNAPTCGDCSVRPSEQDAFYRGRELIVPEQP